MMTTNSRRGASLLEVMSAIIMLGIAIPPLIGLFTQVGHQSVDQIYQDAAVVYAEALLEEIVSKEFEDPQLGQGSFGREEKSRIFYDDIDDYDSMSNSPPVHRDGTQLDELSGFTRTVVVENVSSLAPNAVKPMADGSTNLKRIKVVVGWTAGRGGELQLSTLRSRLPAAAPTGEPLDIAKSQASAKRKSSRSLQLELTSIDAADVVLNAFSLDTKAGNSTTRLKLQSKDIWRESKGSKLPLAKTSLNRGTSSQRTVAAGAKRRLEIHFKDRPKGKKAYKLEVFYADGRSSQLDFTISW